VVTGFLLVPPRFVGVRESVPDTAVAIGGVHGSVTGQAQNRVVGKLEVPVEGIPDRDKGRHGTDTGTSTLRRCKG